MTTNRPVNPATPAVNRISTFGTPMGSPNRNLSDFVLFPLGNRSASMADTTAIDLSNDTYDYSTINILGHLSPFTSLPPYTKRGLESPAAAKQAPGSPSKASLMRIKPPKWFNPPVQLLPVGTNRHENIFYIAQPELEMGRISKCPPPPKMGELEGPPRTPYPRADPSTYRVDISGNGRLTKRACYSPAKRLKSRL